jgi:protein phosphatase
MFWTRHAGATDVGLQRDNNEDAYLNAPKLGLWVVADGMGGHAAGEVASAIVIETIARDIANGKPLADAIQNSHHDILNASDAGVGGRGMGSTVVAMRSFQGKYEICWVGDSRAYLLIPPNKPDDAHELIQLTTDHSYVQMLFQSGAIKEDELDTHPEKNIITQCLGSVELSEVTVDRTVGEWIPNSKLLLCSDGLSDYVKPSEILQLLSEDTHPEAISHRLIQTALDCGGRDNITLTVIEAPTKLKSWFNKWFN